MIYSEKLNKIQDELKVMSRNYIKQQTGPRGTILDYVKQSLSDIMKKYYSGDKRTPEINKTEMPDGVILVILRAQGHDIHSIDELIEVTQTWDYNEETNMATLITSPVFKKDRWVFTITVNE